MAVNLRAQYNDSGPGTLNVIYHVINYTCTFPAVSCQNVCHEYMEEGEQPIQDTDHVCTACTNDFSLTLL